jgi:predicted ATP-grasp superfamily ATP-dependent carboligase
MSRVVTIQAPVIQVRTLRQRSPVGYGATATLPEGSILATVAAGYAVPAEFVVQRFVAGTPWGVSGNIAEDGSFSILGIHEQLVRNAKQKGIKIMVR